MSKNPQIGLRPFTSVLDELGGGDVARALSKELAEVVRKVDDTGKAGKLVLTLSIGKEGKMLRVVADSKVTIPKEAVESTSFFTDGTGSLHKENPRQVPIPGTGAKLSIAGHDSGEE